jgi:hypothetical protein
MEQIKSVAMKVKDIAMMNPLAFGLGVVVFILVIMLMMCPREHFEALTEGVVSLAEYPSVYLESVVSPFVKNEIYDNYFIKPTEIVMPNALPMSQLELPAHTATVPIDIGSGLAANVKVEIPSQTVQVPPQEPAVLPPVQKTDVKVEASQVQLPAQTAIIPVKDSVTKEVVSVPVVVPAQLVSVPSQMAHIPVTEPFRMM